MMRNGIKKESIVRTGNRQPETDGWELMAVD
jgi:hypothetical protein